MPERDLDQTRDPTLPVLFCFRFVFRFVILDNYVLGVTFFSFIARHALVIWIIVNTRMRRNMYFVVDQTGTVNSRRSLSFLLLRSEVATYQPQQRPKALKGQKQR